MKKCFEKKKHLCDKYAWWQIMQKLNDFGKKEDKIILKLIAPTFDAELMTLQKMWTILKLIAATIFEKVLWKKKHLCDKYAWWQIMQKLNDFGKKEDKIIFETNCAYFLLLLLIMLDDRWCRINDSSKNVNSFETNCAYDIWKNALKKKHLCDKYAWWQIMQKLMTLGKRR